MTSKLLETLPFEDGFVMPGEFEPQTDVWLLMAHDMTSWHNGGFPARAHQKAIIEGINKAGTHVNLGVPHHLFLEAERMYEGMNVTLYELSSNDCWARDSGAIYVKNRETGEIRAVDFKFNAWGGEQRGCTGCYLDYTKDDTVGRKMAQISGVDRYRSTFILEGGSITVDGEGTLITTESCLLNPNRNADYSREEIEEVLHDYLGIEKVIWLKEGVDTDDGETDGHIDDVCGYIAPGEVICCYTEDTDNIYYEVFKECYETLCAATDAKGRKLKVHKVPAAKPFLYNAEEAENILPTQGLAQDPDGTWREEGDHAVPSYGNFLITNGAIILPIYDLESDQEAIDAFREIVDGRFEVIPVPAHNIALGGGSVHCITQQIPA